MQTPENAPVQGDPALLERLCPRLMRFQGGALELLRDRAKHPDAGVILKPAKKGGFGLVSRGATLDSIYHPTKSAQDFVRRQSLGKAQIVVLLGAGGGALPIELAAMLKPQGVRLLVFEPDADAAAQLFSHNQQLEELDDRLVQFFTNSRSLCFYLSTECGGRETVEVMRPPAYAKRYPESEIRLGEIIREGLILGRISETDGDGRVARTFSNFLTNFPLRHRAAQLFDLADSLKGTPAVIVASGPSLDKNAHLLKAVQDQVLICAMNTSYQVLKNLDICPHLVFSMESKTTLRDFMDLQDARNGTWPVLSECSHPNLFKLNDVPFFSFLERDPFLIRFLTHSLNLAHSGLAAGGSVAHAAFSGAILLGCDPVILIGQDLAYDNGRVYSKGNLYGDIRWVEDENGGHMSYPQHLVDSLTPEELARLDMGVSPVQPVRTWDGSGTTMTSMDFKLFRMWFEEQGELRARSGQHRLINATEGGCRIEHFEHLPLQQVLDEFAVKGGSVRARLDALWQQKKAVCETAFPKQHTLAVLEKTRADAADFKATCLAACSSQMRIRDLCTNANVSDAERQAGLEAHEALETRIKRLADENLLVSGLVSSRLRQLSRREAGRDLDDTFALRLYDLLMRGCDELIEILDGVLAEP